MLYDAILVLLTLTVLGYRVLFACWVFAYRYQSCTRECGSRTCVWGPSQLLVKRKGHSVLRAQRNSPVCGPFPCGLIGCGTLAVTRRPARLAWCGVLAYPDVRLRACVQLTKQRYS